MKIKRNTNIIDVANYAKVSPATVSRTMNHPEKVKLETRTLIRRAIEETGYIRNRAAQAIHGKRSGIIGLIVPTLDNAIFSNLIQAFSEQLSADGFTMLVSTHGYDLDREYHLIRSLLEHRVEGIALIGLEHREETFKLLERRDTPAVTMWNYSPTSRLSCVGANNFNVGALATQHLIDQGHKHIAIVFAQIDGNDRAAQRYQGMRDTLQAAGINLPHIWNIHSPYFVGAAKNIAIELLSSQNRPSAIIAGNDVIAHGLIYGSHAIGLNVPHDISIMGIGDFTSSADMHPSLTTVRLRPNRVGRSAAKILEKMINGRQKNEIIRMFIKAELKQRESSKSLRIP